MANVLVSAEVGCFVCEICKSIGRSRELEPRMAGIRGVVKRRSYPQVDRGKKTSG